MTTPENSACPADAQLQGLLDGTLSEAELASVQLHADGCSECQRRLEALTTGSESWIGVVDELQQQTPAPEAKLAETIAKIKAEEPDGFARDAVAYEPSRFDLVQEFLTPSTHPGAIGRLGAYEVSEVIGHGGFGAVFKAFDPALHRVVAVKVLASHLAHHAVARRRFIREAQAAAAVCHENVVTIHAIEEAGGSGSVPKIVMQFVSGGSLQERLDQEGPLELKEILRIGMQTAAGLAAAHAQGLVHRDVKPGNILLENGVQRVKLTDFGLARVVDDASLTLSGVIAGTPQYMSPEQAWGRSVDLRGDLFSLGAVLYAMCVGHSPFRARSTMAVLKRVCEEQPRPIQAINPDIPEWLCAIINRLLAKSPDDRFQTAEEIGTLLGGYLAHVQQPTVFPEPTGWRREVSHPEASAEANKPLPHQSAVRGDAKPRGDRTLLGPPLAWRVAILPMVLFAVVNLYLSAVNAQDGWSRQLIEQAAWHQVVALVPWAVFVMGWMTRSKLGWRVCVVLLLLTLPAAFNAPLHMGGQQLLSLLCTTHLVLIASYLLSLIFVRPSLGGFDAESNPVASVTRSQEPVTTRIAPEQTQTSPRRESSKSPPWKWLVGLLVLFPTALLGMVVVVWFSYQSAARNSQAEAMKAQLVAEQAVLAEREKQALRAADRPEPGPGTFGLAETSGSLMFQSLPPHVDPKAFAAMKGRWVVLSAEGTVPSTFAETQFAGPGGMMPGGSAPPGMMPPGMGSGSAMSGLIGEPASSPQLIEFNGQAVKITTSRDFTFTLINLSSSTFVLDGITSQGPPQPLSGTYLIDDDRLVLNWGPFGVPPKSLAKSEAHQLLVCRREWELPKPVVAIPSSLDLDIDVGVQPGAVSVASEAEQLSKLPRANVPFTDREATALQEAWATKFKREVEITNSLGMKLRFIPPGKLSASNANSDASGGLGMPGAPGMGMIGGSGGAPAQPAAGRDGVQAPIYVGVHEVTRGQFQQFVDDTGYLTSAERANLLMVGDAAASKIPTWRNPRCLQDSDAHPVIEINEVDANAFTHWLSRKEKRAYRLLTVNEWEFATRAGRQQLIELGTNKLKHRSQFFASTSPVGKYSQNPFGLHDLIGNAAEWNWGSRQINYGPGGYGAMDRLSEPFLSPYLSGGDYATPIELSQPGRWIAADVEGQAVQNTALGFRVAIDLSTDSLVPYRATALGQNGTYFFETSASVVDLLLDPNNLNSPDAPKSERKPVVIVRDILDRDNFPYAVEWEDIEFERAESQSGPINLQNEKVKWQSIDLAANQKDLSRYVLAADSVPEVFKHKVLTSPVPRRVKDDLVSISSHAMIDEARKSSPKSEYGQKVLVRLVDLTTSPGKHYAYRYRVKYRIPHVDGDSVQTSAWREGSLSVNVPSDGL